MNTGNYYVGDVPGWLDPYYQTSPYVPAKTVVRRTTKTVERYDPQGKLIEREIITEETEDYIRESPIQYPISPIWYNPTVIWDSNGTNNPLPPSTTGGTTTITTNKDVPYTLTNGMSVVDYRLN